MLVLHGPNLSLLAAEEIDPRLEARATELGVELVIAQANGEEGLLDLLHEHREVIDAVVVNPGVLAPHAFALAEALAQLALPSVEVLLATPRAPSALSGVVKEQLHAVRVDGYLRALELLAPAETSAAPAVRKPAGRSKPRSAPEPERVAKSIGRRASTPAAPPAAPASRGKTIGKGARGSAAAPARGAGLTRAQVREQIAQRLKGKLTAEALAQWARETWSALQHGAPVEPAAKDTIENVLLALMAGAKATDAILVSQMAKLES
ncbi:MAG: type II 3-dehydroquinate dehydratase [Myxococcota bacterium]